MPIDERLTRTKSSTFWGTHFGLGKRTDGRGRSFVVSVRPFQRKRKRKSGMRFGGGSCIAVRGSPSKSLPGRSIRNFGDGSTTMVASCPQRSGPSRGMSVNRWFAGLVGNTRSYAITGVRHGHGCCRLLIVSRTCLHFGSSSVVGLSP